MSSNFGDIASNSGVSQEMLLTLYTELKKIIGGYKITAANIMVIAAAIMQLVEDIPSLSGQEKKDLVMCIIVKVINDSQEFSKEDKKLMLVMINTFLPKAIDVIVSASKGELNINIPEEYLNMCTSCCVPKNKKKKIKMQKRNNLRKRTRVNM